MKLVFLMAAVAAALAVPATASSHPPHRWSEMTLGGKQQLLVKTIRQDQSTIRWWVAHRPKAKTTLFFGFRITLGIPLLPPTRMCQSLGIYAPERVCFKSDRVRRATAALASVRAQIVAAALPAHDALWECLRPYEGSDPANRDTGRNGHYGGLQMHPGWGYGTSYYASDDPWIVQKQAAERGYAASGYSSSWLWGQWGQTLGHCAALA